MLDFINIFSSQETKSISFMSITFLIAQWIVLMHNWHLTSDLGWKSLLLLKFLLVSFGLSLGCSLWYYLGVLMLKHWISSMVSSIDNLYLSSNVQFSCLPSGNGIWKLILDASQYNVLNWKIVLECENYLGP